MAGDVNHRIGSAEDLPGRRQDEHLAEQIVAGHAQMLLQARGLQRSDMEASRLERPVKSVYEAHAESALGVVEDVSPSCGYFRYFCINRIHGSKKLPDYRPPRPERIDRTFPRTFTKLRKAPGGSRRTSS